MFEFNVTFFGLMQRVIIQEKIGHWKAKNSVLKEQQVKNDDTEQLLTEIF